MALIFSGADATDARGWVSRLSGAELFILGPEGAGAPVLATIRVPVVEPFRPLSNGDYAPAGAWLGTVLRPGVAESFRLKALEGTLVITGAITATGGGGELELDSRTLSFGDLITLSSGHLAVDGSHSPSRLNLKLFGAASPARPDGQRFKVHWDSWYEKKTVTYPEIFYLTNLPAYVHTVTLCILHPQFRYTGLDDNVFETTGMQFYGSGHQLRNALDVLRLRQPKIRIGMGIQQGGALGFEPYDPKGWAGMTSAHLASMRRFADDMGIREIDVICETISSVMEEQMHCVTGADGEVSCFTDAELVGVIRAFRERFPRPHYTLAFDGYNTGAYFGPYRRQRPLGWNHGYVAALTRNPETRDALDVINIMSFDEQAGYDPVRALEAYSYAFPGVEIYLGLRSGPPWHGTRSMSLLNCLDYINATIGLGTAGIWLYSLLWDVGEYKPPYSATKPDSNMMARLVAERFNLPEADKPLVTGLADQLPPLPWWTP